ncbi:MAG: HAMP domain-containing histidine kinase, partial [Proteobacteria bacterium]|nr:HAMP domain-containing histidine kinase [Pseudomonadota bacterium]
GGEMLLLSVADDGPGIDPAWHQAIFLPFKQVEASEAAGAGIGLALVKKTVERFGGSIEVRSEPAQQRGTTFRVAWPKKIP